MPSQYEIDKKAKLEATKIMQVKHNIIETDESNQSVEPIKPKTFKQKWNNYWYHYKFHTVCTVFGLVLVGSLIMNILTPPKFDASIVIVSENTFDGSKPIIQENVIDQLIDYDKNGKVELNVITVMLEVTKPSTAGADTLEMNRAKIIGMIADKKTFLYMVDQGCYNDLVNVGVKFKDLSAIASNERVQGDKYILKGSNISKELGLNALLDNMYFCLIDFDSFDQKVQKKDKIKQIYENEKDFLIRLISLDSSK